MMRTIVCAALLVTAAAIPASADVVISSSKTKNMTCSNGVCAPTAAHAVLNAGDLKNLLAAGDLTITTNGSVEASNIQIDASFSWTTTTLLTLDAYQSIDFNVPVTVPTGAAATLLTNDGGSSGVLTFELSHNAKLNFASTADILTINGKVYKLVATLPDLVTAVTKKVRGHFALASDYDAGVDGVYYASPIPIAFAGRFNGLGHRISNLTIIDGSDQSAGLFYAVAGSVQSINLVDASVAGIGVAGALTGYNIGNISNSSASGYVRADTAGGLVGSNDRHLTTSQAGAHVQGNTYAGGLVGENGGTLSLSFSTGRSSGGLTTGGLVGENTGTIENCYAHGGPARTKDGRYLGGFVGTNDRGSVATSYAALAVHARGQAEVGGFSGANPAMIANSYWDTGKGGDQGSGDGNDAGLTGLTTAEFRSGLPAGFDPKIWAQDKFINDGFPYLKSNPPQ